MYTVAGHSTHFQVGGDNPKVEGGILQNKAVFYFHFDIFIFENKVAGENAMRWTIFLWNALMDNFPVECPAVYGEYLFYVFFSEKGRRYNFSSTNIINCLH
jgi:hypothetical protein